MRRRLTLAILGVVAGALAVAGVGSLLLVQRANAEQTRSELVRQTEAIAAQADEAQRAGVLSLIKNAGRLYSTGLVLVRPDASLEGTLPVGVTSADLRPPLLLNQQTISAVKDGLAYAAVPIRLRAADLRAARASARSPLRRLILQTAGGSVLVEVATRRVPSPAGGGAYFAVAAALTLVVAAVVADRLGRRIARPLAEVETAARRIAEGDMAGRIDVQSTDYPELVSLGHSINTMSESLVRARGLERQFLLSVSHDLRTPLTSIRGWAEAIADGAADDRRAAGIIGTEAARLERLVQDLLDLAKIDARSFSMNLVGADLVPLVVASADGLAPAVDDAGLRLRLDVAEAPVRADVDPDRLGQITANLIENACRYAHDQILVQVEPGPGGSAVLAVEDDGPGIPAVDLDHVFERLYQAERSPARPSGSGLGLTIVKELTEAMGGTVKVESPTGSAGGTRILLRFPPAGTMPSGA